MAKLERKDMVKAAKELNTLLFQGEGEINVDAKDAPLKAEILEAAELICKDDKGKISKPVVATLTTLGFDVEAAYKKDPDDNEEEEEEEDEVEEEDEEEEEEEDEPEQDELPFEDEEEEEEDEPVKKGKASKKVVETEEEEEEDEMPAKSKKASKVVKPVKEEKVVIKEMNKNTRNAKVEKEVKPAKVEKVVEKAKPVEKKVEKTGKPKSTVRIRELICENQEITAAALVKKMEQEGYQVALGTVLVQRATVMGVLRTLKAMKLLRTPKVA